MDVAWWVAVGDGVWVRRWRELDLSLGVVVGERWCLVVDTGGDEVQGGEFAAAVRELTSLPWTVVVTHAHFDHAFGTAAFEGAAVWGHARCRIALREGAEAQRVEWAGRYRSEGKTELAERLERARVVLPEAWPGGNLDLGGRLVRLVARLCADVRAGLIPVEAAVERSPYPEEFTREALSRM